ncbi:hypothetical protein KY285_027858 [Solanum tuberosum]|nr:hypothetical protein KY285_027858 [Solanum tuberosum]
MTRRAKKSCLVLLIFSLKTHNQNKRGNNNNIGECIALHGGAGDIPRDLPPELRELRVSCLHRCLGQIAIDALNSHKSPLDVVELGVETVDSSHFITPQNIERLKQAKAANSVQVDYTQPIPKVDEPPVSNGDSQIGTVGCVAVDSSGNLAAATSTGGLVNRMVGRIGDTPLVGAGTYAKCKFCAVSCTGKGEEIICATVARDVAALMEYKGLTLKEATDYVIKESTPKGTTGLIAVSSTGEVVTPFNTTGLFRACATQDGKTQIEIW